ncbi:TatD family nuclease-associated radical SAM protein [Neptunomonas antarctica]|uniref:Radical SAM protein, TatD family-associated n=1 Tax=Neptunomonas antarctica TaxID=619304 RepID=A0A1N7JZD7_9GAMM|nr:TatD family nuclease-associated radical SAM protein [Neptunomonas antarctica]SIS54671.1 radical SAM protein, TatD family-associated [Neptunomonas antarctica]
MIAKPNSARRVRHARPDTLIYAIENRLYVNLTDRCTLACRFCPKHNDSKEVHNYNLTLSELPEPQKIIDLIGDPTQYEEVVFCGYGEPTLRLDALISVANAVKANGGKTRLNTDGLANLFHKKDVVPLLATCIDAISISLNAQNEYQYIEHCVPSIPHSYPAVIAFVQRAAQCIPDVTVTAIDGLKGIDISACQTIAITNGAKFKARTLDNVG